ncbi:hypothetical protein [Saccharococcus caldoxylosilyticus]|jgi:hypothetical protein|uniref:Uncharacterized protein n=2 Tax=Saccharococcus caldoxylosilyticus TaxID=81408 RepID=A0A023DJA1_9BACL|nr:hypothetical protein [Parageobacillus caldoxylosilyticus]KYD04088.1 hypothetical protein B4119_2491 [Parageobacillus caldoxylosilyticus]MBB3854275.1 hypothetical protein [Parageobacillus caldoxylosilyticus]BDG36483.1 hypothetical protein PcaKH15_23890 [Parageobacillus caldoxylosilyticus]BDG40271.1 hypothetical protein PcaKH16_24100 [Parageobacillus caldoxylosilyticus]BDG44021.1 hypothetical protein PcaKH35_23660 [Parageobacillus caldoxylosilyticus]
MEYSFSSLIETYRRLWMNRSLTTETLNEQESKTLLYETIAKELRDEMTHPRTRQSAEVKFYYAVKRIMNSDLSDHEKLSLIHIYINVMEQLKQ